MRFLLLAGLFFAAQPIVHADPAFRGYGAVEQLLNDRILPEGGNFTFNRYLKTTDPLHDNSRSLLSLLGTYDETSGGDQFKNGDPNSVSMLLWQLLLQLTGADIAQHCQHQGSFRVNPVFQAALDPICQWPAASAKTDESLRGFWTAVMGFDAPEEDFLAWEQFALSSSYASKPAAEAVPILFFLIAYNPHFLLRD